MICLNADYHLLSIDDVVLISLVWKNLYYQKGKLIISDISGICGNIPQNPHKLTLIVLQAFHLLKVLKKCNTDKKVIKKINVLNGIVMIASQR